MRSDTAACDCSTIYSSANAKTLLSMLGAKLSLDLNSDITIAGVGAGVATWPDQSSYKNDVAQVTGANQPTKIANVLDGHAAVQCVASSQQNLQRVASVTGLPAGSFYTLYALVDLTVIGTTGGIFEATRSTVTGEGLSSYFRGGGTQIQESHLVNGGVLTCGTGGFATITSGPKLYSGRMQVSGSNSVLDCKINNVLINSVSSAGIAGLSNAMTRLAVGCWVDNTFYANAKMYRLVIGKDLTTADDTAVMSFLRSAYPSVGIA